MTFTLDSLAYELDSRDRFIQSIKKVLQGDVTANEIPETAQASAGEPTDIEKGISAEAKKERGRKVWDWVLNETNNFGRGWTDPKWGKLYKGTPGRGGMTRRPGKYTIK